MLICSAGDIHGALDRLYADVLAFEQALGVEFDWVLHVGDFGVWPDPERVDHATRRHEGAGDFPRWLAERRSAPRPTVFIKGNHEDFAWLDSQPSREILPGLHYLPNGQTFTLMARDESLTVGGVGGCYGPADFDRPSRKLEGSAKRHYTRDEVQMLGGRAKLDIVLTHDAPAGVQFSSHRRGDGYVSEAAGLDDLLARTRPRICFFGHHHTRIAFEVARVHCIGLNKVAMPGNLFALQMFPGERDWRQLGEWP
jgi:predicted phosphodiesterase